MTLTESGRSLGLECKYQGVGGSAEEKIPATIQDIAAWPIPGLVVFAGGGFSDNMRSYLHSTGKAVALEDLESWLRLFLDCPKSSRALTVRPPSIPTLPTSRRAGACSSPSRPS